MGLSSGKYDATPAAWPPAGEPKDGKELATFAAGCFWGVELLFQRVPGVTHTAVGYVQGGKDNPSYEEVCTGATGHTEAVQLVYDPKVVSFEELCRVFYSKHDPTTKNRQGGDVGTQYRSGIYTHSPAQMQAALAAKAAVPNAVTEVEEAKQFWPAETYHQQYLEKGGRFGRGQSAKKGCSDPIRCYG